jgi:hypothetical protein
LYKPKPLTNDLNVSLFKQKHYYCFYNKTLLAELLNLITKPLTND